jgi:hypothetical protein
MHIEVDALEVDPPEVHAHCRERNLEVPQFTLLQSNLPRREATQRVMTQPGGRQRLCRPHSVQTTQHADDKKARLREPF